MSQKLVSNIARAAAIFFLPAWSAVVGGELGNGGAGINLWDKAMHFSAYFILALLVSIALAGRRAMIWALLGLVAMGGALEIMQGLIGRDCSIYDELANTLGVMAGALVARVVVAILVRVPPAD
jgi:VanZ family protein